MALTRLGEPARGHLAMLLFSALVAGSFSLGTRIANDIAPVAVNAVRFALAAAIIGAIALPGVRRAHLRAPWRYLLLGGLFATYFVLMFEGLKTAPPVSGAAVFTLTPVLAAGFGWLFLAQRPHAALVAALLIGALGALWVIFRADLGAFLAFDVGRGEAIYFIGVIAHAAYTPLVCRLNRGEPARVFTFGMMLAALLVMLVYGLPELRATDWGALPARVWWGIAYLAVFASATTFLLLQYAALRLPSAKVMAYTYLTPSWVIGWEMVMAGATPPGAILPGIALSVLALLILLRPDPVSGAG